MKGRLILAASSAAALGFFIGISFSVQMTPEVKTSVQCGTFTRRNGDDADANSTSSRARGSNMLDRFWGPLRIADVSSSSSQQQMNATSEPENQNVVARKMIPKAAERLPPDIVVSESDLHLRRIWGNPSEDTAAGKYLLALTVGYTEKANVNATVHKFSDKFDVVLFHYDGKTTEWDADFAWSKNKTIHVSARKQAKWWYAKRFLHPSIVAPYDYVFLWDEDLDATFFDADEYLRIVNKHGLEISQPALDITTGGLHAYDVTVRRTGSEVHRSSCGPGEERRRPCSGFVEVMAPVFTREAWACVWHMVQNDLVHGWALDWNFWRCVDDPEEQVGVVDAQFVVHRGVPTLLAQGSKAEDGGGSGSGSGSSGSGGGVNERQWTEFHAFTWRLQDAEDKARQAAQVSLQVKAQAQAEAPPPQDG